MSLEEFSFPLISLGKASKSYFVLTFVEKASIFLQCIWFEAIMLSSLGTSTKA